MFTALLALFGYTIVTHSSGMLILTGAAGYVAGSLAFLAALPF